MSKQLTFSATVCALTMALFVISTGDLAPAGGKGTAQAAFTLTPIGR